MSASTVTQELKQLGNLEKAKASARFFKTDKGQYGYGDKFFGVTVPEQRRVAKRHSELPLVEVKKLLQSDIHECRLTALFILVGQYEKGDMPEKERIVKFYLSNLKHVNNWDLVDSSAPYILGDNLLNKDKDVLYKFARSKNLWERRVAIVSTGAFIKAGKYKDTFKIAELLLKDEHDLIHKATGWMLREVGKNDRQSLLRFLDRHASQMPRTMLRYAIEHLNEKDRGHYMGFK